MFKQKNILISLAVAALVAACGGGGSDPVTPPAQQNSNNPPPGGTDNTSTAPTADAKLASQVVLQNMVFKKSNTDFIQIAYSSPDRFDFHSSTPRDATVNPPTDASSYGAFGFAQGTNAPLQAVGYQISIDTPATADSKTGRVAFELQDQAGVTPQEILRIEIDKIISAVDANGGLTVTVPSDAKVYVFAKGAAGQATVSAPATAAMVSVIDAKVDETNSVKSLVFNVDEAVGAAVTAATGTDKTVMSSVKDFGSGVQKPFEVTLLFSNLDITLTPPATGTATALTGKDDGKGITVDGAKTASGAALPGVLGGGATGFVQVNEPDPTPAP
jgi:hypothetical protein